MRFLIAYLIGLSVLISGCKAQDTISYTNTEVIYGRKDGMALTMLKLAPKERSNGKAIISIVSGNWVSSFNWRTTFLTGQKCM